MSSESLRDNLLRDIQEDPKLINELVYGNEIGKLLRPILIELTNFMENDDNAVQVMMDYLKMSTGADFEEVMEKIAVINKNYNSRDSNLYVVTIRDLELCARITNALARRGIKSVQDIVSKTKEELYSVRGIGNSALGEITIALSKYGLKLRQE